jgi:sulfite exporter TauE/SafE
LTAIAIGSEGSGVSSEIAVLAGTAAAIGFGHTLLGPDHYLPFIVLARARRWGGLKTAVITLLCGVGHILSSVVLGFVGIALGVAVFNLEAIESFRGEVAAWLLLGFGFAYFVWGVRRAIRRRPHDHVHGHANGSAHLHTHAHAAAHTHIHDSKPGSLTPWVLFIVFLFGPCEPLIPILMYPAAEGSIMGVVAVASIFGVVTIATMLCVVLAAYYGLSRLHVGKLEQYSHALAGLTILLCGGAIKFLGL